jgi:hypothetical protein
LRAVDVQLYRLCDELSGALILPMLVFSPWAFGTTEPWSIWYWLETRITFGWLGFGMLLAALACVVLRWFVPGGIQGSRRFVVLAWLALAGCLVEARFDYPFQIHSTLFLFLVICALLFGFSEGSNGGRR